MYTDLDIIILEILWIAYRLLEITDFAIMCCLVCVTTFTMPVHLHGIYFAPFLLLTRRCYDAETSAILLLLKRAFT